MVSNDDIARAAALLRAGEVVAFPTETVYGLGADASNPAAVAKIYALKGRPSTHPVIVHLASAAQLSAWVLDVPERAATLAARFWPGPLTMIFRRSALVPDIVTGGQDSVAIRVPVHPVAQALLQAFGGGIAGPSANRFGHVSATTADHVRSEFGDDVPFILEGGDCDVGIESTIVDLSRGAPRLLRPGSITRAQLEAVLGIAVPDAGVDAPRASGRLESHYAPRTPLECVEAAQLPARLNALRGQRLAVLAPAAALLDPGPQVVLRLVAPDSAEAYAQQLYALLHRLDAAGAERILVAWPPAGLAWEAVHDRLRRARSAA